MVCLGQIASQTVQGARRPRLLQMAALTRNATWMVEQLAELEKKGWQVTAALQGRGQIADLLQGRSIQTAFMDMDFAWEMKDLGRWWQNFFALYCWFRQERFDVVHYHVFTSAILGRLAAWAADVPVRVRMIEGPFYLESTAGRTIESLTQWMDTWTLASSRYTRALYRQAPFDQDKIKLVYFGTDPSRFNPQQFDSVRLSEIRAGFGIKNDDLVVGRVAYFYPPFPRSDFVPEALWGKSHKDYDTLIEAIPQVLQKVPNAKFLLIGDGWGDQGKTYMQSLQERTRLLGVSHAVIFAGYQSKIDEAIAAMDIVVQCSLSDNLGGTKEYMLLERPVVATTIRGFEDTVINGKTGLTISPGDSSSLAGAISLLLTDREFSRQLGVNGRQHILTHKGLTLKDTVCELDQLYRQVKTGGYNSFKSLVRLPIALLYLVLIAWIVSRTELTSKLAWNGSVASGIARILQFWVKRAIEIAIALLAVPLALLLCSLRVLASNVTGKKLTLAQVEAGGVGNYSFKRWCLLSPASNPNEATAPFKQEECGWLHQLPILINVLSGEASFVGPRITDRAREAGSHCWSLVPFPKPGLVSWSKLNQTPAMSDDDLDAMDLLYVSASSLWLDLRLLLKWAITRVIPAWRRQRSA